MQIKKLNYAPGIDVDRSCCRRSWAISRSGVEKGEKRGERRGRTEKESSILSALNGQGRKTRPPAAHGAFVFLRRPSLWNLLVFYGAAEGHSFWMG